MFYQFLRSPPMSVADRISELEKHQPPSSQNAAKSSAKDSGGNGGKDKTSLKAIQKKALLSFYERHHSAWRSEPQLTPLTGQPLSTAQPLTSQLLGQAVTSQSGRPSHGSSRRSSSASDYGGGHWKEVSVDEIYGCYAQTMMKLMSLVESGNQCISRRY